MRHPVLATLAAACLIGWEASPARPGPPETRTLRVRYTPKDQQTGRYQYVPFEVAPGTTRIGVEYRYDKREGSNVVDLGLFEPGPLELGTKAYRGWSGGERSRITVGVDGATPGYWPGPLPAGEWRVMLGLYKVAEPGVEVELTIETSREPAGPAPSIPPPPREPIRTGPAWYAGALHAHTVHSDGTLSALDLAKKAREEGLDFLAITDHNNTAQQLERGEVPGLLRIVGEELTTPGGHANVWGLGGWRDYLDFRVLPGDGAIESLAAQARARGALVSLNHPMGACFACSWTHAVPEAASAIEISGLTAEETRTAIALWDQLLRGGRRLTAVASSDWHRPGARPLSQPCVRVWASELGTRAILDAVREGRVIVTIDPSLTPPALSVRAGKATAGVGDTLALAAGEAYTVEVAVSGPAYEGALVELVWRGERVAAEPVRGGEPVRFQRYANADGYLRVHVLKADLSPLALTNPVWLKVARP